MVDRFVELAARIIELRQEAKEEELTFSEASYEYMMSFLNEFNWDIRPSIFLIGNGNLRVLWRNEALQQIGIQFITPNKDHYRQTLQYNIFLENTEDPLRVAGYEWSSPTFRRFITYLKMDHLWYSDPTAISKESPT